MGGWRVAQPEEVSRLWPAAKSAHVAASMPELVAFYESGPWRVRVSAEGDAMVLARWRAHLDSLAIRGLWVAEHRVDALVVEARSVARAQGFSRLLSPLLSRGLHGSYLRNGMREIEPIVALQGIPGRIATHAVCEESATPRRATYVDIPGILRVDRASFDDFWRYGREDIETVLAGERLTVVLDGDEVCGYASANIRGYTCTLGRLAVAPDARRRGVGRALVTDVARWAAEGGSSVLSLCTQESNAASRALYARCGLLEVDERYGILATEV